MGIFGSIGEGIGGLVGPLSPKGAIRGAEKFQRDATQLGIDESRRAREQARADSEPFRQSGTAGLKGLSSLITDPAAQKRFLASNPFYKTLADETQKNLFNQQAAKGKFGSGGTATGLQSSLTKLGNNLLSQAIGQRFNSAVLGANAAAGQATGTLTTASTISDLLTQGGNSAAAGVIGQQNATTNRNRQLATTAASIFASDRRVKRDIKEIGTYKDIPVYSFKYIWDDEEEIGFMAQDVQEIHPNAVMEIDGILHVNYSEVFNGYQS